MPETLTNCEDCGGSGAQERCCGAMAGTDMYGIDGCCGNFVVDDCTTCHGLGKMRVAELMKRRLIESTKPQSNIYGYVEKMLEVEKRMLEISMIKNCGLLEAEQTKDDLPTP